MFKKLLCWHPEWSKGKFFVMRGTTAAKKLSSTEKMLIAENKDKRKDFEDELQKQAEELRRQADELYKKELEQDKALVKKWKAGEDVKFRHRDKVPFELKISKEAPYEISCTKNKDLLPYKESIQVYNIIKKSEKSTFKATVGAYKVSFSLEEGVLILHIGCVSVEWKVFKLKMEELLKNNK